MSVQATVMMQRSILRARYRQGVPPEEDLQPVLPGPERLLSYGDGANTVGNRCQLGDRSTLYRREDAMAMSRPVYI